MKDGSRVGNVVGENLAATAGYRAHGRSFKTRFCWTCQKDKPLVGGKIHGIKGIVATATAGKCRFECETCMAARSQRKAERVVTETPPQEA